MFEGRQALVKNRLHHWEKRNRVNKPWSYSLRHSSSAFLAAFRASTDVTLTLRAKDQCVCVHICVRAKSPSTGA